MKQKHIYLYILLSTLLMLLLGIVYSYSIFRIEIESIFNVSKQESALPYMLVLLFYAISMAFSGVLYDRYKTIYIAIIGLLLVTSGFILSSIFNQMIFISLFYGVLIGSGIGILYTLPLRVVAGFDHPHPGFLTGITLMGFGLSPLIFAPLIEQLLSSRGLSETFFILGVIYFILLCPLILLLVPKDKLPKAKNKISFDVLKNKDFYKIYVLFFIGTFIGLTMIGFTSSIGVEVLGISKIHIAFILGIFSIFNGVGRPLFGYLNDKLSFKYSSMISFVLILISATSMLLLSQSFIIFIISFVIFYINLGGWLALAPAATIKTFGKKDYSKTYGFMFTAYGLGAFIGNGISSRIVDVYSYQGLYMTIGVLALLGMTLSLFTLRSNKKSSL